MATYNLAASDLITLLHSTVASPAGKLILETLMADSPFAGFPFDNTGVNTTNGPSDTTSPSFPITSFDTVPSTSTTSGGVATPSYNIALELITVPTSTISGSIFTAGVIGSETLNTPINITTVGGLVVAAGDQYVAVIDYNNGSAADTLVGGAFQERLISGAGSNVLIGGTGFNTLIGGAFADTLIGGGSSRLVAGIGANVLKSSTLSSGQDTLLGGSGPALLIARDGNNRLIAGNGLNTLMGGAGHDTLISGGNTFIMMGTGDGRVVGSINGAHDTIEADPGSDTVVMAFGHSNVANSIVGSTGGLRIVDLSGSNTITGGAGGDTIVLTGTVNLNGSTVPARVNNIADQTMTAGTGGLRIVTNESFANYSLSTGAGGAHTVSFSDTGQKLFINDTTGASVTIVFAGDGHTPVVI
jgi:Ca2+-binding RTX toxin-like protein